MTPKEIEIMLKNRKARLSRNAKLSCSKNDEKTQVVSNYWTASDPCFWDDTDDKRMMLSPSIIQMMNMTPKPARICTKCPYSLMTTQMTNQSLHVTYAVYPIR